MRIVAIICNVALLLFTSVVLVTDGVSRQVPYVVLVLLLLLAPILNVLALVASANTVRGGSRRTDPSWWSAPTSCVAVLSNLALIGFSCWAIVDQYPHPEEAGFVPFVLLVLLTPILSLLALLRRGTQDMQEQPRSATGQE